MKSVIVCGMRCRISRQRADPLLGYYGAPTPFTEETTGALDNIDTLTVLLNIIVLFNI